MSNPGRRVVAVVVLVALVMLISPVRGQPPRGVVSDLDALLGSIGQRGIVNNQPNYLMMKEGSSEHAQYVSGIVIGPPLQKTGELEKLGRSSTREVAEAASRLKPAIDLLNQATAAEQNSKDLIARLSKQNGPSLEETLDAGAAFLSLLDPGDLDTLVAHRKITREEADEFLRQRGNVKRNFANKFVKSLGDAFTINIVTFQQTHRLRNRADVLMNDVVAKILAPALRARAGNEEKSPPVQVNLGLFSAGAGTGLIWYEARVNVRSSAARELTRLTLLFEFQTPHGSRYATIYIPKLPAGGGSFDPIALDWVFLSNPPKDRPESSRMEKSRVRYSVWCDQFRAEGQEPAITLDKNEMRDDTRLLAMMPGLIYVSQGGNALNPNPAAAKAPPPKKGNPFSGSPAPHIVEFEPDGRFEVVFTKLMPLKQAYEVEVELIDHRAIKAKNPPQRLRGVVTLSEFKGDLLDKRPLLKLTSAKQEIQLEMFEGRGEFAVSWQAGKGLAVGRRFHNYVRPAPDSPGSVPQERLSAAMTLVFERKFAEAQQAYEKIAADYPDTVWASSAGRSIGYLKEIHRTSDTAQKSRAEANQKILDLRQDMAKKAQEEANKNAGTPPARGRPPLRPNPKSIPAIPERPSRRPLPKKENTPFNTGSTAKPSR